MALINISMLAPGGEPITTLAVENTILVRTLLLQLRPASDDATVMAAQLLHEGVILPPTVSLCEAVVEDGAELTFVVSEPIPGMRVMCERMQELGNEDATELPSESSPSTEEQDTQTKGCMEFKLGVVVALIESVPMVLFDGWEMTVKSALADRRGIQRSEFMLGREFAFTGEVIEVSEEVKTKATKNVDDVAIIDEEAPSKTIVLTVGHCVSCRPPEGVPWENGNESTEPGGWKMGLVTQVQPVKVMSIIDCDDVFDCTGFVFDDIVEFGKVIQSFIWDVQDSDSDSDFDFNK